MICKHGVEIEESCDECIARYKCNDYGIHTRETTYLAMKSFKCDKHICDDCCHGKTYRVDNKCKEPERVYDKMDVRIEVVTNGNQYIYLINYQIIKHLFNVSKISTFGYDNSVSYRFELDKSFANYKKLDEYATQFRHSVTME
jgi:hypothetical protein